MRFLTGTFFGIALIVGATFFHDNNVAADPPSTAAERQIVNWDVLGTTVREQTAFVRRLWDRVVGR